MCVCVCMYVQLCYVPYLHFLADDELRVVMKLLSRIIDSLDCVSINLALCCSRTCISVLRLE